MNENNTGILTLAYPGQWFLVDMKTKIKVNGQEHSTHSIKKGFTVDLPITSATMQIEVALGGIKSTKYELAGLDTATNYTMNLNYSDTMGKFSKDYKLVKEGEQPKPTLSTEPAKTRQHEQPEPASKPLEAKWYNNSGKLAFSILFWPAFLYGLYKTGLISRKRKQFGFLIIVNLFACLVYIANRRINDVKIPFPESEPDYYGSMVAEYDKNTTGADLQRQVDEYKSSHGESSEHEDWAKRKFEWEEKQATPLPPLFYIYLVGSFGAIIYSFTRRKPSIKHAGILFLLVLPIKSNAQTKGEKELAEKYQAPLSEAYDLYALVNHWKTYNDKWGYTVSFPKSITDGGTTASGIHYYDGIEIAVESSCVDRSAMLKDELKRWYSSTLADISPNSYTIIKKELTDQSFIIIKKDKEGSTYYDKCITGAKCLFKLSFYVDKGNIKRLSEKDADVIIHLFTSTK